MDFLKSTLDKFRIFCFFITIYINSLFRHVQISSILSSFRFRSETPYLNDSGRNGSVSCDYSKNTSYVVFSAMGSFFVPLTVMLYVYARISCVIANRHDNLEAMNTAQHVKWPLNNTVSKGYQSRCFFLLFYLNEGFWQ